MMNEESGWHILLSTLFRPRLLLQGVVEYASAWLFTRNWLWMLFVYSPIAALLIASITIVSIGASTTKDSLINRYVEWIDEELPEAMSALDANVDESQSERPVPKDLQADDGVDSATESSGENALSDADLESITPYGELLLRRLLQLTNENARATYLVAGQLFRQGRVGQARQMMRRVAPEGGGGFSPAHAWLATDQAQYDAIRTAEDWKRFDADMETAILWSFTNAQLIAFYANQLAEMNVPDAALKKKHVDRALAILARACQRHPELQIALANMAAKYGRKQSLERVSNDAKELIRARMVNDTATVEDLANLANLFLLEQDPDRALKVSEMGLKREPSSVALRRLVSEAYRMKYLQTLVLEGDKAQVNLAFLDAALKSDPTNPGVSVEVAKLIAAGKDASPEMKQSLQNQILSGQATALARILLADRLLREGDVKQALPHLEAAHQQAPDNPLVLNNLGLALAHVQPNPDSLDRALELANLAVSFVPDNPEYRDTLGEIRLIREDKLGALESYEAAIALDGTRTSTRRSLAKLYRELGMVDMARLQEAEIEKLTKPSKE